MLENDSGAYLNKAQETLEQFERSIHDPFVERVLVLAREYNQLLAETTGISPEEEREIVNELDYEWGSVMDTEVTITGHVTVPPIGEQTEVTKLFIDGARAVSNGFTIIHEPIIVAGEEIGTGSRIVHHMYMRAADVWPSEEIEGIIDANTRVALAAEIDGSLLELDGASVERAISWLGLACPELLEEVDERLLNTQTNEEADAFLALRGLDINKHINISDDFTRNCIDIYLNSVIDFDKKLPYSIRLDGYSRRADKDDGHLYAIETDQLLAYIPVVGVWPKFSDNPEDLGKWDIGARVVAMPEDKSGDDIHLVVPVDALALMYSVRNSFYNS